MVFIGIYYLKYSTVEKRFNSFKEVKQYLFELNETGQTVESWEYRTEALLTIPLVPQVETSDAGL